MKNDHFMRITKDLRMDIVDGYFDQTECDKEKMLAQVSEKLGFSPSASAVYDLFRQAKQSRDMRFCENVVLELKAHLIPIAKRQSVLAKIKENIGDSPGRQKIQNFYLSLGERKSFSYCAAVVALISLEKCRYFETICSLLRTSLPPNPTMGQVARHVEAYGYPRPSDFTTRKIYSHIKTFSELWLSPKGKRTMAQSETQIQHEESEESALHAIVKKSNFRKITFGSLTEEMVLDAMMKSTGLSSSLAVSLALNSFLLVVARGKVDLLQLVRDSKHPNFSEVKRGLRLLSSLNLRGV
ncbi:hypothetical protein [Janthinobacterium sp. YR213]|uniref:hypothetical protein n=1 Tax=Janthinobacterium sp. YR213 TaxID=1881027 RepID=UPI000B87B41B|nr:hypothetical protein [Janthinobacterium sp. YR213]